MARVGVIGGGAFGTAMACVLRRSLHEVVLWAREAEVVDGINRNGVNGLFLPEVHVSPGVRATGSLRETVAEADFVLMVAPAQHVRAVALQLESLLDAGTPVVACSKGIERHTHALMPRVLQETLPGARIAVLSGPSFARDIANNLPAGVTLASRDYALARTLAGLIGNPRFRVEPSTDLTGVALGGVMKNVVSIASGIAAGKKLGESARATLITLGLDETVRLGLALGAHRETFDGFAGVGDLMLTANSLQSRNTSLGFSLGEGKKLADLLASRREVTEGVHSAESIAALAQRLDVPMPISRVVDQILNHGADVDALVERVIASR